MSLRPTFSERAYGLQAKTAANWLLSPYIMTATFSAIIPAKLLNSGTSQLEIQRAIDLFYDHAKEAQERTEDILQQMLELGDLVPPVAFGRRVMATFLDEMVGHGENSLPVLELYSNNQKSKP